MWPSATSTIRGKEITFEPLDRRNRVTRCPSTLRSTFTRVPTRGSQPLHYACLLCTPEAPIFERKPLERNASAPSAIESADLETNRILLSTFVSFPLSSTRRVSQISIFLRFLAFKLNRIEDRTSARPTLSVSLSSFVVPDFSSRNNTVPFAVLSILFATLIPPVADTVSYRRGEACPK